MPPFVPALTAAEVSGAFPGMYSSVDPPREGGQGAVFRALTPAGACHAIKVYFPDPGGQVEERTDREIIALQHIACPTIAALCGHGSLTLRGDVCRFVTTAYVDGEPLSDALVRSALDLPSVARLGRDLAAAIDVLWQARLVHRDIKPANVMLSDLGAAVLIDLGVARHTSLVSLTMTGATWGTRGYMSPEQAHARKALTCKSDVFSLGVLLQAALLGRHPTGNNQNLLLGGGIPTEPSLVSAAPMIGQLIDSMLLRDPNRRPLPAQIALALESLAKPIGVKWP